MSDPIKYMVDKDGGELRSPIYPSDAGMDVIVIENVLCLPHSVIQVPIGIRVVPPPGTCFTFITRSSAVLQGLFVVPTLIDGGYRGPLFLFVMNVWDKYIKIVSGTRIAQILLLPNMVEGREIIQINRLPDGDRGTNGFGSSGGAT